MYIFVFQNFRHRMSERTLRMRRMNASSTYGQFDLRLLRKCLKSDYQIEGFAVSDLHKLLYRIDLQSLLPGHCLTITTPQSAIWVKLNHESVGHPGLDYHSCYNEVDLDYITSEVVLSEELQTKISNCTNERYQLISLERAHQVFMGNELKFNTINKNIISSVQKQNSILTAEIGRLDEEYTRLFNEKVNTKKRVTDYMVGRRLSVAPKA